MAELCPGFAHGVSAGRGPRICEAAGGRRASNAMMSWRHVLAPCCGAEPRFKLVINRPPGGFSTQLTAWGLRAAVWGTVGWLLGWKGTAVIAALAAATHLVALVIGALPPRGGAARALTVATVAGHLAFFAAVLLIAPWRGLIPFGIGVVMCHAVAYVVDVYRGAADPRSHAAALLYVAQFPVFPAGPLSRLHDFAQQLPRADISMGAFAYGVRRIVTGLMKVLLIAGPLGATADSIFALRLSRLATSTAWLGVVCFALEIYFLFSGFSDVGIGVGKVLGFRLPENFRRPYTADSVREFWRRWNVTLITWLRDYLSLPIAGHARPTPRLYAMIVAGFVVVGLWHRASMNVFVWAVYSGSWLALEELGLHARLQRLPAFLRHAYVLIVVLFGWLLLRGNGPGPTLGYTEALLGYSMATTGGAMTFMTPTLWVVLPSAILFAGPLVGWISRWRVSVDAATASLLMMLAATCVFVWRIFEPVVRIVLPARTLPRGQHR